MIVKLEFDLPEEQSEFELAIDASNYALVIYEIDQWLRSGIKYAPEGQTDDYTAALEKAREKLHELIFEYGIKI